jgi:aryl-alcohol dehydrogenase-like predicted oxidoreductase
MQYLRLGRTGLKVSRLCLGTMNFGPHATEPESHEMLDRALDLGVNFVDTANVYGQQRGEGITEQIVGRWLAQGNGRRERVVLATKVYGTMGAWPNESRLSALHVRRACEGSLRRLKTDHIDLYQLHHIDRETPWEELFQALEQLVREGKVLYVGSSNFAGWHIAQACERARARNFLGLVSEQSLYNLLARTVELEVLPACEGYGVGFLPWSPLAGGLLSGALSKTREGRTGAERMQRQLDEQRERIEQYEMFCADLGAEPAQVALAWVLTNPAVTAPIVGPRTLEHLESAAQALSLKLSAETLRALDELFPGPGGAAPEAYAW